MTDIFHKALARASQYGTLDGMIVAFLREVRSANDPDMWEKMLHANHTTIDNAMRGGASLACWQAGIDYLISLSADD
jgi:hypothetical protein